MRRAIRIALAGTLAGASCAHVVQTVSPRFIEDHAGELRAGHAVAVPDDERSDTRSEPTIEPEQTVELVDLLGRRTTLRLRDAIAGCPAGTASDRRCSLAGVRDVIISDEWRPRWGWVAVGLVAAGGAACALECSASVQRDLLVGTGVLAGAVVVGLGYLVFEYGSAAR